MAEDVTSTDRIDLAHTAAFSLAGVRVQPATREVIGADGIHEVVEPRVMQVLVALARADGAIVSRDDLTHSCWDGRVVGEDAINRVISRLRRVAEGIGGGAFRIETVTKVGYRLVREGSSAPNTMPPPSIAGRRPARRTILGGAVAGLAFAAGGSLYLRRRASPRATPPADVASLIEQARTASRQSDTQGNSQAIGLYRRVVELHPDYADGWGALANAYANAARNLPAQYTSEMEARARAAAQRALSLDPHNAFAQVALVGLLPTNGNWLDAERVARQAIADHPDNDTFLIMLGAILIAVGRASEASLVIDQAVKAAPPSPSLLFLHVQTLWAANRLEETDNAMAEAYALYPLHIAVWFARFFLLMFTGRAGEAISFGMDRDHRPPGIPAGDFDLVLAVARAIESRAPSDIDSAMRMNMAAAHRGSGYAGNMIKFASALGRLDDAFAVAEAFFFGRGFEIEDIQFTLVQGGYLRRRDRSTVTLFLPSTAAMRADPRFERLVADIGLTRYWAQTRSAPDYKKVR